jgi:hypothetical protein
LVSKQNICQVLASLSCRFRTNLARYVSQRKKVLDKIVFTLMATQFKSHFFIQKAFHQTELSSERKVQQLLARDMTNVWLEIENRRRSSKIMKKCFQTKCLPGPR